MFPRVQVSSDHSERRILFYYSTVTSKSPKHNQTVFFNKEINDVNYFKSKGGDTYMPIEEMAL